MSAQPVAAPAERAPARPPFAGRALHGLPCEARLLRADLLYGRLLARAARHAGDGGPAPEGRLRRADGRVEPLPLAPHRQFFATECPANLVEEIPHLTTLAQALLVRNGQ